MKAYALPASIIFLALSLIASVYFYNLHIANGSVAFGNDYTGTYIATGATSTPNCRNSIGSVTISSVGTTGVIAFYATSSIYATSTNDLVFSVDGAAAEGTYVYDVAIAAPLQIDAMSFNGSAVVTCR